MATAPRPKLKMHGPSPAGNPGLPWHFILPVLSVFLILAITGLFIPTLGILLLVFGGVLFGVFLHDIAAFVANRLPITYRWSYAAIVVLLFAIVLGVFYYMGAQFVNQVSQLTDELEAARERVDTHLDDHPWMRTYLPTAEQLQKSLGNLGISMLSGVQAAFWGLTSILVVLILGLYLAYDPELYVDGVLKMVPQEKRQMGRQLFDKLHHTLAFWIIGRIASMTIIGVLTSVGLWFLGVPLPFTLGVLAGLLTFIPNIGPILAAIPQALLALQLGMDTVLYVLLFNVGLQTVESYLITPIIQRYAATLPPVLTISAQLLMGVIVGLIGVILAAPITAALMVSVQLLWIQETLHDPEPGELVERA